MVNKEFNNLEEIKKYYNKYNNTYIFKENGEYIQSVVLNFDLDVKANINALNINAQHILDRQELIKKIDETNATISVLLASDKDDIKSWITEKHHYFCYERKCIDYQSLDCIEKRYGHYVDEGGNSFVADLMNEIRALPKVSTLKEIEMENKKK